ncbi:unnamed protein product [Linum trigynum]|uniref:Uncharacterized protein n=1 Tax=Linum trigynum TaxID=586398 RepID=A0AAV2GBE9_9ROSI
MNNPVGSSEKQPVDSRWIPLAADGISTPFPRATNVNPACSSGGVTMMTPSFEGRRRDAATFFLDNDDATLRRDYGEHGGTFFLSGDDKQQHNFFFLLDSAVIDHAEGGGAPTELGGVARWRVFLCL